MKTLKIIVVLALIANLSMAQNKKYIKTMKAAIDEMYSANESAAFDQVVNKFTRIGQAEKTEWEPFYYAAQSHVFKGFRIADLQAKDVVLDQALSALSLAEEVSENNVEIILLQGFINMIKIGVDPATRGQTLSPGIMGSFGKALKMAPNNPRANLFMAQMQIGTAAFFGTGTAEPCKMINRSIELFDQESPENPLAPIWGKQSALEYQNNCSAQAEKGSNN